MSPERTLTVAEAARALRTSEKAIRRKLERKALPSVRDGRHVRIPASALGLDSTPRSLPPAAPAAADGGAASLPVDYLDRLERLARENGSLRQLEVVAGESQQQLIEARARIRELEEQLRLRPRRRWWRRS